MTVYTIAFPKGGTTKTTTAAELVSTLAARGSKVLAVDLDEQGTLTSWLGFTEDTEVDGTASDVLTGQTGVLEAAAECPAVPGAWLLVGTHDLETVTVTTVPDLVTSLRDLLPTVADRFDDVVIDAPPALGGLTLAGLAAADVVIAPVACEVQALDQIDRYEEVIAARLASRVKPGQRIHTIIPTRYDGRRRLDREIVEDLTETYGDRITITEPIHEAVAVRDSYAAGLPIGRFAPTSRPAQDYAEVLTQIIEEA